MVLWVDHSRLVVYVAGMPYADPERAREAKRLSMVKKRTSSDYLKQEALQKAEYYQAHKKEEMVRARARRSSAREQDVLNQIKKIVV